MLHAGIGKSRAAAARLARISSRDWRFPHVSTTFA
jgi:hypothetical protein